MKFKFVFILIILAFSDVRSQELSKQLSFGISYFGVLGTHPGIKIGIQYPIATIHTNESSNSIHQIMAASNLFVYFHRRNQIGTGLNFELGYRNRHTGKTNKEIMFGLGFLRTFVPNAVYDFSETTLTKRKTVGTNHFMKSVSLGMGRNLDNKIDSDFWMIKPTLFHLKPYNTKSTLNFALDVGYYFH